MVAGRTENQVFRVHRYAPDYPGLAGRDLTPGEQLEIYPCRDDPAMLAKAKLGILEASLVAGVIGYWVLRWSLPKIANSASD